MLSRIEASGKYSMLTCSSTIETMISFCGAPSFGSSGSDLSLRLSARVSGASSLLVSGTLSTSIYFCGSSWVWTLGSGEEIFSSPFSSWTVIGVPRYASGLSSSLYIFINSLKGLCVLVSIDN
jgi:hypothetical protein